VNFDSRQHVQFVQFRQQLFRLVTKLARFARDVDFEQDGHCLARLVGALGNFRCQVRAVHALDHLEQFHGVAHLVRLQMADELPAGLAGTQRDFRLRLLNFVFAKQKLAAVHRRPDGFRRMCLGNRQQRDGSHITSSPVARCGNALMN